MNKFKLLAILFFVAVAFAACKKDTCKTCELSLLGVGVTTEACEDGDDLTVTTTSLGVSETETVTNTSLNDFVTASEAAGMTCN